LFIITVCPYRIGTGNSNLCTREWTIHIVVTNGNAENTVRKAQKEKDAAISQASVEAVGHRRTRARKRGLGYSVVLLLEEEPDGVARVRNLHKLSYFTSLERI
jgi:hypothetical protein